MQKRKMTPKIATPDEEQFVRDLVATVVLEMRNMAKTLDTYFDTDKEQSDLPCMFVRGSGADHTKYKATLTHIENDADKRRIVNRIRAVVTEETPDIAAFSMPAYLRIVPEMPDKTPEQVKEWVSSNYETLERVENIFVIIETKSGVCATASMPVSRSNGSFTLGDVDVMFITEYAEANIGDFYDRYH